MDDDAERGVIFILGLALGLLAMWLIFTTRGRQTAQAVFEAAEDLAENLVEGAEDLAGQAAVATGLAKPKKRFGLF